MMVNRVCHKEDGNKEMPFVAIISAVAVVMIIITVIIVTVVKKKATEEYSDSQAENSVVYSQPQSKQSANMDKEELSKKRKITKRKYMLRLVIGAIFHWQMQQYRLMTQFTGWA